MKSILDGKKFNEGDLKKDWQEFVLDRQEHLCSANDDKITNAKISNLLKCVNDKKLANKLSETITERESNIVYMNYSRGFFEGFKAAVTLAKI